MTVASSCVFFVFCVVLKVFVSFVRASLPSCPYNNFSLIFSSIYIAVVTQFMNRTELGFESQ